MPDRSGCMARFGQTWEEGIKGRNYVNGVWFLLSRQSFVTPGKTG